MERKEDLVQAVVIADTFKNNFHPFTTNSSLGLFPVCGVPLIDFMMESLAQGGVDETILFCCNDGVTMKKHINKLTEAKVPWSLSMEVQVMMSDSCRTMGDVMRELDAAGALRGYFVLLTLDTVTNVHFASLLQKHKQICKKDKGAAMTLLYQKVSWGHNLINPNDALFLATDGNSGKVLLHNKCRTGGEHKSLSLPLDVILNHSKVDLHHNLVDTNIALCSPSVLPLFSDNFDFQTRDDFINGILINEEILASSLYYVQLKGTDYAANISNWKSYQTVSRDILHHWAYPLTIETGEYKRKDNYIFMGNHNYRNKNATLSRSCELGEDVLICGNTSIDDNTRITKSILGQKCKIGKNVVMSGTHLQPGVTIGNNCNLSNSYIGADSILEDGVTVKDGTIIAPNVTVKSGSELSGATVLNSEMKKDVCQKSISDGTEWDNESTRSDEHDSYVGFNKVWSESCSYCSSSSSEDLSIPDSPELDDFNIFLQEVIDSLARGYEEKLKCDYLILEINSSRYAYNIQLHEVNFFVVRAILSIPALADSKNVLASLKDVLKFFRPVLNNYIKTESASMDCLKAIEESCISTWLEGRTGQIIHFLYEADVLEEDTLLAWYKELKTRDADMAAQPSLVKFFDWLQQASEESDSE